MVVVTLSDMMLVPSVTNILLLFQNMLRRYALGYDNVSLEETLILPDRRN
jgi:hypothetical protein